MRIDLFHNQIVKDTATKKFADSLRYDLIPSLESLHGESLNAVLMYEDHLSDGFTENGRFYYPLTLSFTFGERIQWISWDISNEKLFRDGNPYAYLGLSTLNFALEDSVPMSFDRAMKGRPISYDENAIRVTVETSEPDKRILSGKYEQSFIDELARALTPMIEEACGVRGVSDSSLYLRVCFSHDTFMEHTVDHKTYRRLQICAHGCSNRDFWISWTRLDGNGAYTVSDLIRPDNIRFELAEDVPNRIREKEYRYLAFGKDSDKYMSAVSRRHLTEWRETVRVVLRRGEVASIEKPAPIAAPEPIQPVAQEPIFSAAPVSAEPIKAPSPAPEAAPKPAPEAAPKPAPEAAPKTDPMQEALRLARAALEKEGMLQASDTPAPTPEVPAYAASAPREDSASMFDLVLEGIPAAPQKPESDPDAVREEIERKIRAEYEAKAEQERERLRLEKEELERMTAAFAEKREAERLAAEKAEAERLAAAEAENARLAAVREEIERLAAEREEAERLAKEREAERLAAEKAEAERLAAAKAEIERLAAEREAAERLEKEREAKRLAAEKAEAARLAAEEVDRFARIQEQHRRESAVASEIASKSENVQRYTYVSRKAVLTFNHTVDPNVTHRIHELILATMKHYHKENLSIKVTASIPEATRVVLDFVRFPEVESEFLVVILKVLGNSDLGIIKITLD